MQCVSLSSILVEYMYELLETTSNTMAITTLGDFINTEIERRHMSAREFARFVGVAPAVINKFRDYGTKDVGYPSVDVLLRLSKATGTDICYLMALVDSDAVKPVDIETRTLAETIRKLPQEVQLIIRGFITNEVSRND